MIHSYQDANRNCVRVAGLILWGIGGHVAEKKDNPGLESRSFLTSWRALGKVSNFSNLALLICDIRDDAYE